MKIRAAGVDEGEWAAALLSARWGSARIVSRGRVHEADQLPGFVAWEGDERVGLLTYLVEGSACEIVSLDSLRQRIGVGIALLEAVKGKAIACGCTRLWLVTTNDNLPALSFYRKRGFVLVAVHTDAVTEARALKPEIPQVGYGGIPIGDELEFEMRLDEFTGS